jgi:hypothetical protein
MEVPLDPGEEPCRWGLALAGALVAAATLWQMAPQGTVKRAAKTVLYARIELESMWKRVFGRPGPQPKRQRRSLAPPAASSRVPAAYMRANQEGGEAAARSGDDAAGKKSGRDS